MPDAVGTPRVRHLGAGTFLLRLKNRTSPVTRLRFACGSGRSRSIPIVTTDGVTTTLLIKSRAPELAVCDDARSHATWSVVRVPIASTWLLRRLGRLAARTGIAVGPDVFIRRILGRPVPASAPIEHVVLDTPRLATLEAFGVSLLRDGAVDRDLLDDWPRPADVRHAPTEKSAEAICVVVHLHYRDLWPELEWFLRNIPFAFRLVVSLTEPSQSNDPELRRRIENLFEDAAVCTLANRGRDIGPFLALLRNGALGDCPILCKVHGKKSASRSGEDLVGRLWRRRCLLDLLGNAERVREIVSLFEADPGVGMVGPQSLLHTRRGGIRQSKEELNHSAMRRILSRRGIDVPTEDYQFFAGTMFWVRRDALRLAEALALSEQDFPAEPAPGNGTTSHAMERLLGVSVHQAGMRLVGLPEIDAGGAKSGPRAHRPLSPDYLKTP